MFRYGYFGVDVFMMLSGFGLCRSYESNGLSVFYKRRLTRLLPLYWTTVTAIVALKYALIPGTEVSFLKYLANLTTLAYYGIGGGDDNWFVAAILLFYILFPLMYKMVKKLGIWSLLLACAMSFIAIIKIHPDWRYDCLITRIPIFLQGIILYQYRDNTKQIALALGIMACSWIMAISYDISRFFSAATICPFVVYFVIELLQCDNKKMKIVNPILEWCGKYSFAIFTSNSIVAYTMGIYGHDARSNFGIYGIVGLYALSSVVYGYVFAKLSDCFDRVLR